MSKPYSVVREAYLVSLFVMRIPYSVLRAYDLRLTVYILARMPCIYNKLRPSSVTSMGLPPLWRSLRSLSPFKGRQITSLNNPNLDSIGISKKEILILLIYAILSRNLVK